jgi:hypothetical protein
MNVSELRESLKIEQRRNRRLKFLNCPLLVSREQLPRGYDRKRTVMNMRGFSLH